ncbi:PREDICTED: cell cycle checkpoint protein RAD1 [Myotis brandtii]|uniref:cell cycle checkpoint protein RAD1 n=1 Tax=Myotis brandtii TaxID=109478 RepID=UPI0007040D34|nr:PREDICTED: cell cycle checkpoint protein RAD1 [Myotis brandtii]
MVTVAETARRSESRGGSGSTSSSFPPELHLSYPVTWERSLGVRTPPRRYGFRAWDPGIPGPVSRCPPRRAGESSCLGLKGGPLRNRGPTPWGRAPGSSDRLGGDPWPRFDVANLAVRAVTSPVTCFHDSQLFAGIFQEFKVQEEPVTFRINLTVLLDCLSIFGSSPTPGNLTALRMCYQGYGCPLMLFLEEGGVVTVCKINTQEPEETLDFDFCSTNVINKIILQSEGLREAFSELDMTSEVLQITMSPEKPYFRLSTFGNAGSSHLDYPKDSDLMESFNCNETQVNRYKISLLKPSTKALVLSCKVSIRTDNRGFLSLQYMIRNEDGQICFVEYYCCPDEEVPDSES